MACGSVELVSTFGRRLVESLLMVVVLLVRDVYLMLVIHVVAVLYG